MKVDISVLSKTDDFEEILEIELEEVLSGNTELAEGYFIEKPVKFKGIIAKVDDTLQLSGILNVDYRVACFRCLKDIEGQLEIKIEESYTNSDELAEELDAYQYDGDILELDKAFKDNIILSLPTKKLCTQDCKGICPICGINLNESQCDCTVDSIHPQLEKLKDWFNK